MLILEKYHKEMKLVISVTFANSIYRKTKGRKFYKQQPNQYEQWYQFTYQKNVCQAIQMVSSHPNAL